MCILYGRRMCVALSGYCPVWWGSVCVWRVCGGEWCIGVKQARRPAAGGKSAVSGGRGGAERAEEGAARVCVCAHKRARARVARVTGPGCEGAKRTAQRPGTAARAAGSAGGERRREKTRAVHPHTTAGVPLSRGEPPSAQRPAHGAPGLAPLGHPATASLYTAHSNTADTAHTPTHHVRIGKTYTHALCSAGPAARRQRIIPRPARVSSRYSARSAALFVFGPSLHRHPPGQGGPGAFCAFPAVCRAWRHAACAAGAQYLAAMQGRAQRCAALCGQPDNRPRCSLGSGLCALYGRCAASSVPSLYCGPGRLGVSMARAFVRCDCAGRALLADVRGGVVCK